jgi:protein-tyrosine kinase
MSELDKRQRYNLVTEAPRESLSEQARIVIRVGRLNSQQIREVVAWQKEHKSNFASGAIQLGFIRREDLMAAISRQYSYPVLSGTEESDQFSAELVVGHEPFDSAAEAVRSIRTSMVATAIAQGTRSFAVTGPRHGAGSTFFAANIALAFAQMAMPTLLVDANLRNPRIAELFGLSRYQEGLCQALQQQDLYETCIVPNVVQGLCLMTAGDVPPNPQELLSSGQFIALTNNVERDFGVVIYDTPAAMEYADASIVVARVGAAIIVARQHETSFDEVTTLAQKFRASECKFLGTVMNSY